MARTILAFPTQRWAPAFQPHSETAQAVPGKAWQARSRHNRGLSGPEAKLTNSKRTNWFCLAAARKRIELLGRTARSKQKGLVWMLRCRPGRLRYCRDSATLTPGSEPEPPTPTHEPRFMREDREVGSMGLHTPHDPKLLASATVLEWAWRSDTSEVGPQAIRLLRTVPPNWLSCLKRPAW